MGKRQQATPLTPRPVQEIPVSPPGKYQAPRRTPAMPEPAKKPFYKSKRIWGLVAAAAGYLGLSDAQILADGIQPDEIVIIGGWVLALIGSIVAKKPISLK